MRATATGVWNALVLAFIVVGIFMIAVPAMLISGMFEAGGSGNWITVIGAGALLVAWAAFFLPLVVAIICYVYGRLVVWAGGPSPPTPRWARAIEKLYDQGWFSDETPQGGDH